jgi:non-lysosomal glucosylceramidase
VLSRSDLPLPVLDAVSANLSILKSPTVTRLQDGTFYGWEGCHVDGGSCEGSCTHVWNYQQALPFLYPDLARSMLDAEFEYNQDPETGGLGFRLPVPLGSGRSIDRPCADGHFGAVIRTYREWQQSGDDAWLDAKWPAVKRAIAFAWHPGNYDHWDPDKTGVLWGRQHHTLDMELFGPNSWLTGFYLGALRAGARMAAHLGDTAAVEEFEEIFERGRAWVDENLFKDGYFRQSIDLNDQSILAPFDRADDNHPVIQGSIMDLYWSDEHGEIKYQIGEGSSIDQVLAQWHSTLLGLGDLFEPDKVKSALEAIYEYNFYEDLGDIMNPCRVYGVAGESGSLICAWPEESPSPAIPAPYSQETMHGFEYSFGGALMQVGEIEKGIRVFRAVRDRYRGANRNPWNEIECGSNYARSMASYAAVPILSGMRYDQGQCRLSLDPMVQNGGEFASFWSVGGAWGEVRFEDQAITFEVIGGSLPLTVLALRREVPADASVILDGRELDFVPLADEPGIRLDTDALEAGSTLIVSGLDLDMSSLPDSETGARADRATVSTTA